MGRWNIRHNPASQREKRKTDKGATMSDLEFSFKLGEFKEKTEQRLSFLEQQFEQLVQSYNRLVNDLKQKEAADGRGR